MKECKWCGGTFLPRRCDTQYCSVRCGNAYRSKTYRDRPDYKERREKYLIAPKYRHIQHRASAKRRNIPSHLTFEDWWGLWEPFWEDRGVHTGGFVMCRAGDKGAYEIGNVRIDTSENNREEWRQLKCE